MAIFENKEDIFELMGKFEKSSLFELEIALETGFNIKLSKNSGYNNNAAYTPETKNIQAVPEIPDLKDDVKIITAPLVGTFYSSPSPDSEPYVKIGDKVSKGMIVCIIEAMKIMNEIESEADGEIAEILVENNSPVEYGQPLFRLK